MIIRSWLQRALRSPYGSGAGSDDAAPVWLACDTAASKARAELTRLAGKLRDCDKPGCCTSPNSTRCGRKRSAS